MINSIRFVAAVKWVAAVFYTAAALLYTEGKEVSCYVREKKGQ